MSASSTTASARPERTTAALKQAFVDNLYFRRGTAPQSASAHDRYDALALAVRDHLTERWRRTAEAHYENNPRFVYYFSAEYLLGPQMRKNMLYAGLTDVVEQLAATEGIDLEALLALDPEPGLGNGGLGRLAACFLDSLATLDIPCVGYGIRYQYGIFQQTFRDGWQVESPDDWLYYGYPWEFPQPDDMVEVWFGGHTESGVDEDGHYIVQWHPGEIVMGEPYHTLVPGYDTGTVNMLRLWRARASREFNFQLFDQGHYAEAVEEKTNSENITKVLYPNDITEQGKMLRLKQQYFFVACSLRDIIRRFRIRNKEWEQFPEKVVIQLNDTHPVVAIPELMRILLDEERLGWDKAWAITQRVFAYTCHTLLPEALEKWPIELFGGLLPRHLEIIYEVNQRFLDEVRRRFPDEPERVERMSLIEERPVRQVRMAHLASVGSFSINGVAELQSRLLREQTLSDFADMYPQKFNNKTNGVTPRRFMRLANPRLSSLITSRIGGGWLTDLEKLRELEPAVDDPAFREAWREAKYANKVQLAANAKALTGVMVDPHTLFDIMVKRLHEYKRQLLKVMHVITLYHRLKDDPGREFVPRTVIFGAKAAPGYRMAKLIIKLANNVADVVNHDPDVANRLKVLFLPNFNVTLAQIIYPAADISEQISMAGKEASGTGNMKFALNGAITVGTLDGANIEIRERVGEENFFLFGLSADEVFALKAQGYRPMDYYDGNPVLRRVVDGIAHGEFSSGDRALFEPIVRSLLDEDRFLHLVDYQSYVDCQDAAARAYLDQEHWTRMSILNVARCGFFSSDRSMRQYCADIWRVEPLPVTSTDLDGEFATGELAA